MADIVAQLQQLGFGEYEARAYMALLQRSPLNGYEVAKASGLPRANVYGVLDKLQARGAVVRLDTPEGVRYAPVPPAELIERIGSRFQETLEGARQALEKMAHPAEHEYVWNARGYPVLLEHARGLLDETQETLLLAIWPQESAALATDLARTAARGIKITTLCLANCKQECGGCQGRIHRYEVAPEERSRWLVVVPDGAEVLAGEIIGDDDALAVRTHQRLLVDLATWYIRHSIALAAVVNELGSRLPELLSPETRAILVSVGPGGESGGWLEYMRHLLHRDESKSA